MVMKANRAGVLVGGASLKGKGTSTEGHHFNIRPMSGDIFGAYYPAFLQIEVESTTQYLNYMYRIFPHPEIDGKLCIDGCHRYFAGIAIQYQLKAPYYCFNNCKEISKPKPKGSGEEALEKSVTDKQLLMSTTACDHYQVGKHWYKY